MSQKPSATVWRVHGTTWLSYAGFYFCRKLRRREVVSADLAADEPCWPRLPQIWVSSSPPSPADTALPHMNMLGLADGSRR